MHINFQWPHNGMDPAYGAASLAGGLYRRSLVLAGTAYPQGSFSAETPPSPSSTLLHIKVVGIEN